MNVMMILLTILLLPMSEQIDESVEVDTVLHIQFTNADGYAMVDTPVTYRPDAEYGAFTFECVTDGNGQCDIPVQFDTVITHPSVFGSVYVHGEHVQSAVFRRSDEEMTIPIEASANRLNPHETIHDDEVQIVPVAQETVAVMLRGTADVASDEGRATVIAVTEEVPFETIERPLIPTIGEVEKERGVVHQSPAIWMRMAVVLLIMLGTVAVVGCLVLLRRWR